MRNFYRSYTQYICRLYPITNAQWKMFPHLLRKIFRTVGDIVAWRSDVIEIDDWNACDRLEVLWGMMKDEIKVYFHEFEEERHLVAIDPALLH